MKSGKSKKHIFFSLLFFVMASLAAAGAATYLTLTEKIVSYALFGGLAVCGIVLFSCAIAYACKKDKLALDEISVGLMVDVLLLLMTVCSPIIFVVWIIEKIHDAVSANRYKNV
ncbi:MAG: hypothetical protein OSJ68_06670 [Clostridia bacterium]|nr:hypothetical protein [Clostridia bacterium]